jgi:hypothetical protein
MSSSSSHANRRAGCHLCERALAVVRDPQAELGFEFELVEIDAIRRSKPITASICP